MSKVNVVVTDAHQQAAVGRLAGHALQNLSSMPMSKQAANRVALDYSLEFSLSTMAQLIATEEELELTRHQLDDALAQVRKLTSASCDHAVAGQDSREEIAMLSRANAQLVSDMACLCQKVAELRPDGDPPMLSSPIVYTYWIVDTILRKGYMPK